MILLGFSIISGGLGLLMILERLFPDQPLSPVPGWWKRVVCINLFQLIAVIFGHYTWESLSFHSSIFELQSYSITPFWGGLFAYLINTWIFYWWHYARHEFHFLWRFCHQLHHSASRIETITSFYKHPVEILLDSFIMTCLLYPILGLSKESSIWLSGFSAFGEYIYHMNIKTPYWMGYFFQRPECHRIHHLRNKRIGGKNFADLPLWDILNGTFENPKERNIPTGFSPDQELKIKEMLQFKEVVHPCSNNKNSSSFTCLNICSVLLFIMALFQPFGYLFTFPLIQKIGLFSMISPLPLVFSSYQGVETFSTSFELEIQFENDNNITTNITSYTQVLTPESYGQLEGPYNRRNAYGVLFSHGPFFTKPELIRMRDHALKYGFCENGPFIKEFYLQSSSSSSSFSFIKQVTIYITSKTKSSFFLPSNKKWKIEVFCTS